MSNRIIEVTKKSGDTVLGRTYYYQKPNGNTYKKIVTNEYGEPSEITDYTYNSWNLMESASVQKGNTKTDVTFKYDATNRRNGKITKVYENGRLTDSKTTEYIWYGDKVQYEEVTQNKQVSSNVNMWGVTGIAARNEKLFSSDAHGNTDAGYDGTSVKRYTYDAYGNAVSDDGEDDNPYRYCGENYDEETSLYYLRARYYDPSIGRFMSEDPAQDGLNWYNYCGNNPINRIDPNGQNWFTDAIKNKINDTWKSTKWAFYIAEYYADEAQKSAQRTFWTVIADKLISGYYGYETTAWLLKHSLQENPYDVTRGNDSRIAYLINHDEAYLSKLDAAIRKSDNGLVKGYLEDIAFNDGDLYYCIHNADIYVDGYRQENGSWLIHATMTDTYDYTQIMSFMNDDEFVWEATKGTIANDMAYISQHTGAINEYKITVDFYTTRYVRGK